MTNKKGMIKTILGKTGEGVYPTLGGFAGGIGGWFATYSDVLWSAVIFAVVGGVLGFLVGKAMQWLWKCVTKNKSDD